MEEWTPGELRWRFGVELQTSRSGTRVCRVAWEDRYGEVGTRGQGKDLGREGMKHSWSSMEQQPSAHGAAASLGHGKGATELTKWAEAGSTPDSHCGAGAWPRTEQLAYWSTCLTNI